MQINKKRILSPQRYLYALNPDESFYLAAWLMAEDVQHLLRYGIIADGNARIPTPRGPATTTNADGKWAACRGLTIRMLAFLTSEDFPLPISSSFRN